MIASILPVRRSLGVGGSSLCGIAISQLLLQRLLPSPRILLCPQADIDRITSTASQGPLAPPLPRGPFRQRDPAEPRQVHRRVLEAHERIQADGRRPRRTQLADAEHTRQAGRPARHIRHQLLEVVCCEPPPHPDGRPRKPLALGARDGTAHALRRASHRRVPRQDRRARTQGGRVEDASRGARQPLVRRRRRRGPLRPLRGSLRSGDPTASRRAHLAVAASMCGCVLEGTDTVQARKPAKPKVKLSGVSLAATAI